MELTIIHIYLTHQIWW